MTRQIVKILKDCIGHDDKQGQTDVIATRFQKGKEYEIGPDLLRTFIAEGAVELLTEPSAKNRETKIITGIESTEINLSNMNRKQLDGYAKQYGVKISKKMTDEEVRAAIHAADSVKAS
jgi:hypothetical protein